MPCRGALAPVVGWGPVSSLAGSCEWRQWVTPRPRSSLSLKTWLETVAAPWVPVIVGAFLLTYSEHVTGDRGALRGFKSHSADAVAMSGLASPSDTAPLRRGDTVFLGWVGLKEGPGEPLGCPASSVRGTPSMAT